jgi:hypothetical protein
MRQLWPQIAGILRARLEKASASARRGSRVDDPAAYCAEGNATDRFDFVRANPPFNVNAGDTAMRVSASRQPEGSPHHLATRQNHERLKDMSGTDHHHVAAQPARRIYSHCLNEDVQAKLLKRFNLDWS